ncbi:MAG: site-2 protease family protein [Treponema sp.]|jgi:regulator of sigma E protease|nr:site-2 protease family protein [Treponema sp.]
MLIIKILLGLFGLGVVVFIHELGHFLAARLVKIDVEAFSIGWGKPVLKKKIGNVEYRLGMFPLGGYCKMKGVSDHEITYTQNGEQPEVGSYLAASPAARILVCFGGPFFNLIFAILLLSLLWGIGFSVNTLENRIVLSSEIIKGEVFPADTAGLQTGDRVVEIEGQPITYFHEMLENIALNPNKELAMTVERDGRLINLSVTPYLDKTSGAGRIGVYSWTDPVIESVQNASPAEREGLLPRDIITSANGIPLHNTMELYKILDDNPYELVLEYNRGGVSGQARFSKEDMESQLGFSWAVINYRSAPLSLPKAVAKGTSESWKTLTVSVKSLRLLFMGIDLTQAVSGPARITYMIGEAATHGFEQGIGAGLRSIMEFLALISVALCVMNLLPIPILDGGMIILFLIELIRGKPAPPKALSILHGFGMLVIFGLIIFALFGDVMYFIRR